MKLLIAGLGSIGRRHLRNLQALGEEDILLYRTGRGTLPDEELAKFPVETNLQSALAQRPQAVVVANPTALHLDVAIPAARLGCHLLLEKPVSHNLEKLAELRLAVQEGGGKVLVGFQFRFHPGLQRAAALLREGAIGRPLSARAVYAEYLPGWHPWENYRRGYSARADLGGGVILTLSHPLDYLHWLLGDVESVWAYASHLSDLELDVEDTAEIGLKHSSGALTSVHLDYNKRPPVHFLEIVGSQGTLRWENESGNLHLYRASSPAPAWEVYQAPDGFERNHMFLEEMRHFLDIASSQADSRCTMDDGEQALRLALAALHSAQEKRLIALPEIH